MFGDGLVAVGIFFPALMVLLVIVALILLIVTLALVIRYLSLASNEIKSRKRKKDGE